MNELLLKIWQIQRKIHQNGELSIKGGFGKEIVIRCTWFLDQPYCYEERFQPEHLVTARQDLLERFVKNANHELHIMTMTCNHE